MFLAAATFSTAAGAESVDITHPDQDTVGETVQPELEVEDDDVDAHDVPDDQDTVGETAQPEPEVEDDDVDAQAVPDDQDTVGGTAQSEPEVEDDIDAQGVDNPDNPNVPEEPEDRTPGSERQVLPHTGGSATLYGVVGLLIVMAGGLMATRNRS